MPFFLVMDWGLNDLADRLPFLPSDAKGREGIKEISWPI
jgi:hypothetical protein